MGTRHAARAALGLVWLVGVAGGCASKQPAPRVEEALKREVGPLPSTAINAPDSAFVAHVESKGSPIVRQPAGDGVPYLIGVPIGTESSILCFVAPTAMPITNVMGAVLEELGTKSQVKMRGIGSTDAGALFDQPYFAADVVLIADADGQQRLYQVKMMAVGLRGNGSMMCVHDEVGYRQTFRRVVTGLANSMQTATAERFGLPRYKEVFVARVDDIAIGVGESSYYEARDQQMLMTSRMAMFVPRSAEEVLVTDEVNETLADAQGAIEKQTYFDLEGGELTSNLLLDRRSARAYHVTGTHRGAPIEGELETPGPLPDDRTMARRLATTLATTGGTGEVRIPQWAPDIAPLAVSELRVKRTGPPTADGTPAVLEIGERRIAVVIDAQGLLSRMTAPAGDTEMTVERVFQRGTL